MAQCQLMEASGLFWRHMQWHATMCMHGTASYCAGGIEVCANPPPSVGGALLGQGPGVIDSRVLRYLL